MKAQIPSLESKETSKLIGKRKSQYTPRICVPPSSTRRRCSYASGCKLEKGEIIFLPLRLCLAPVSS